MVCLIWKANTLGLCMYLMVNPFRHSIHLAQRYFSLHQRPSDSVNSLKQLALLQAFLNITNKPILVRPLIVISRTSKAFLPFIHPLEARDQSSILGFSKKRSRLNGMMTVLNPFSLILCAMSSKDKCSRAETQALVEWQPLRLQEQILTLLPKESTILAPSVLIGKAISETLVMAVLALKCAKQGMELTMVWRCCSGLSLLQVSEQMFPMESNQIRVSPKSKICQNHRSGQKNQESGMLKLLRQQYFIILYRKIQMQPKVAFVVSPQRISFPKEEEKILKYWETIDAFKQQLAKTQGQKPYTFYDGPPFATGLPHYGHICAGTIKDVVCRYASQTGHHVERRFGWDCHGLPVEYEIDKALGIKDKKQVLEMGIGNYNKECRSIVMKYSSEWRRIITRLGRWIDFDNDYKTLNTDFMESVWYVFSQIYKKGLVYRGRKIMPYSAACNTVLSNFQTAQNYKMISDPSVYISFPLLKDPEVKLVAWTTTPWTLPSNLALAVNPTFDYVKVKDLKRNQTFILAESRLEELYGKTPEDFQVIGKMKGSQLQGLEYQPLFDYFADRKKDGCFKILAADFVTSATGTGVVHIAPGFGDDDYKLSVKKGIITPDSPPVPINENGFFTSQIKDYEGKYFKDADKFIKQDLKAKGRLVQESTITHNYPFCWRSDTPLMYRAIQTWFIKVTDIKDKVMENNRKAYWVPKQVQEGRFDSWLRDAEDWCFSRSRFWGNPIPLWISDDGEEIVCVGSVQELKDLSGVQDIPDLHRQYIDHITIPSKQGKGDLKRIEEVFDCWFESGSMPYAQAHYPFTTSKEQFSKIFPADFISQGIDQTRGWFYTLNVIATALMNDTPYKNLIVNGLVLASDGTKLSKRLKNYTDPEQIVNQYGADAIRMYLMNSPLVKAENLKFKNEGVQSVVKDIFLPWYNAYRFLTQNIVRLQKPFTFVGEVSGLYRDFNITDKWIESSLQQLLKDVRKQMDEYKLYNVAPKLIRFLNDLTNWYVRLNRSRIKGEVSDTDMHVSINVLFDVILKTAILLSPQVPFITEYMYLNLRNVIDEKSQYFADSIHFLNIPQPNEKMIDPEIQKAFVDVQEVIETARKLRENKKISLKQPISSLTVISESASKLDSLRQLVVYIQEQINVEKVNFSSEVEKYIRHDALPNFLSSNKKVQDKTIQTAIKKLTHQQILAFEGKETVEIAGLTLNVQDDLVINNKFVDKNVQKYEVIGGKNIFTLLDTRQDQGLKIKGFAREFVNRVQKLKKKSKFNPEDQILIFFKLEDNAKMLKQALEKERKFIETAVKKPLVDYSQYTEEVVLEREEGMIDDQKYEVLFTRPGPVISQQQLKKSFGESAQVIVRMLLSTPYSKLVEGSKGGKYHLILDGKQIDLEVNKHFRLPF